jgi:hypothetical protein
MSLPQPVRVVELVKSYAFPNRGGAPISTEVHGVFTTPTVAVLLIEPVVAEMVASVPLEGAV